MSPLMMRVALMSLGLVSTQLHKCCGEFPVSERSAKLPLFQKVATVVVIFVFVYKIARNQEGWEGILENN